MVESEIPVRRLAAGWFATVAIATLPFTQVLTGSRTAMYGDVNDLHVPLYLAAWRNVRAGMAPFWSNGTFAGQNLLGSGQSAMFYPVNAMFGWLDPVVAYRWWLLFHIWVAATGAFVWAWWRWRSVAGAVVAGFGYALNGFIVLHIVHMPFVAAAAWLPFAVLGIELLVDRWTLPRVVLGGGGIATIALAGHGQGLWLTLAAVGVVVAARLVWSGRGWRPWARCVGGIGVGLAIGSLQLLPQFLFSRTSGRGDLDMEGAFDLAAQPRHLLTLVLPHVMGGGTSLPGMTGRWTGGDIYHEVANYAGITLVLLAVIGAVWHWRDRRVMALLALSAFGLVAAVGDATPFGRLIYTVVPLAGTFRGWARDLLWLNLSVSCLAALGVRTAAGMGRAQLVRTAVGVAVAVLVIRLVPVVTDLGGGLAPHGAIAAVGIPMLLLLAALGAVALTVWKPRVGAVVLIAVCGIDMVSFALSSPWRTSGRTPAEMAAFYSGDGPEFGVPYDAPGGVDRWVSGTYVFRSTSLVNEVQGINGYDSLVQEEFAETAGGLVFDGYPTRDDFWEPGWLPDVLRVTTLVVAPEVTPTAEGWEEERPVRGGAFVRWIRDPRLDEASLVGSVEVMSLADIRVALRDESVDLESVALVEDVSLAGTLTEPGPAGTADGAMDASGSGTYTVHADRPALLVVSYGWLDGWSATVDGAEAPVVRTNGLVLGVPVPAGRHEVQLSFTPPGLQLAMLLAFVGLVGAVTPSVVARWGRRRAVPVEPEEDTDAEVDGAGDD